MARPKITLNFGVTIVLKELAGTSIETGGDFKMVVFSVVLLVFE